MYAKKDDEKYFFLNIYAPNNHYDSVTLLYEIDEWLEEAFEYDSGINIVVSGDYNFVIDPNLDSIGRSQLPQEKRVVEIFKRIVTKYNLIDSFKSLNDYGGFTWGRDIPNIIRSRLDYIFISKNMQSSLLSCNSNIQPNESDHQTVFAEFEVDKIKYGPGIIRGNSNLLEKPEVKSRILNELRKEVENFPISWNAHTKLDYVKYKLRDLFLIKGRIQAKYNKSKKRSH